MTVWYESWKKKDYFKVKVSFLTKSDFFSPFYSSLCFEFPTVHFGEHVIILDRVTGAC